MLLHDFYTIQHISTSDNEHEVLLTINASHALFKGHFPDKPVLPGVCSLNILKECVSKVTGEDIRFKTISNCKFLSVVDPSVNALLRVVFFLKPTSDCEYQLQSTIYSEQTAVLKIKAEIIHA